MNNAFCAKFAVNSLQARDTPLFDRQMTEIPLHELRGGVDPGRPAAFVRVRFQVIEHRHPPTFAREQIGDVRTDQACSTGDARAFFMRHPQPSVAKSENLSTIASVYGSEERRPTNARHAKTFGRASLCRAEGKIFVVQTNLRQGQIRSRPSHEIVSTKNFFHTSKNYATDCSRRICCSNSIRVPTGNVPVRERAM